MQLYKCSKMCEADTEMSKKSVKVFEVAEEKKSSVSNFIVRKLYKNFNLNIGFNFGALLRKWHFAICLAWHFHLRMRKRLSHNCCDVPLLSLNSFWSRTIEFFRRWKTFRLLFWFSMHFQSTFCFLLDHFTRWNEFNPFLCFYKCEQIFPS